MHNKALVLFFLLCLTPQFVPSAFAQNVGIGLITPAGKLHIKGASNASQFIIDAHSTQSNSNPLIRLRNSSGIDLLGIHTDDSTNVFIGLLAGKSNVIGPQGVNNTFIGNHAGYSNTNGRDNTIVGYHALYSNLKGSLNTAVGTFALYTQSFSAGSAWWESRNVAIGHEALFSNQPTNTGNGQSNTAVGTSAMRSNTTGYQNIGVGAFALYLNTTGYFNTAAGYAALNSNTTGIQNTAVGSFAMFSNTGLSNNTALGYAALYLQANNPEGWLGGNVAVGYKAMYNNLPTTYYEGAQNTAVGNEALTANITGYGNTAIGYQSLFSNYYGSSNTAVGYHSLYENGGNWNTAVGHEALYLNYDSTENAAHGYRALYHNTEGENNVAVGSQALWDNVTGNNNVAIGYNADNDLTGISNNTIIGAEAHVGGSSSNCVVVGKGAFTNVANLALLGNTTSTPIGGYDPWMDLSDARFKTRVQEDVIGLDFILRLRPITYHMDVRGLHAFWGIGDYGQNEASLSDEMKSEMDQSITRKEDICKSGFIAQEVETAALETGYDFNGVVKPAHEKDHYRMAYAEFVVPLVKAVQEQQAMIEELRKENAELKDVYTSWMNAQQEQIHSLQSTIMELKASPDKQ